MDIQCIFEMNSYSDKRIDFLINSHTPQNFNISSKPQTTVEPKYQPQEDTDKILEEGSTLNILTNKHCITFMKEYADTSLEELRVEDYAADLKGPKPSKPTNIFEVPQSGNIFQLSSSTTTSTTALPPQQSTASIFSWTNTTSKPTTNYFSNMFSQQPVSSSGVFSFPQPSISAWNFTTSTTKNSNLLQTTQNPFAVQPQTTTTSIFSAKPYNKSNESILQDPMTHESIFPSSSFNTTQDMNINTNESFEEEKYFSCIVKWKIIPENQELRFIGDYKHRKTNYDVIFIKFKDCTITKVPQGLTKAFPNLRMLWISNSKLKHICKDDLAEYKNFEAFRFDYNEIETLPEDLFDGFKNLKKIEFYGNKLSLIEPNILDDLKDLQVVDFSANQNYGKKFSVNSKSTFSSTLEEVKRDLFEKYPNKYEIYMKLKTENQDLMNLKLELKNEKLKNAQLQKGFLKDLKKLTQDEATKDFKIIIENREFSVHKFLLQARTSTLADLIRNNPEATSLNLDDISVKSFEIILKFLYTDEFPADDGSNFLDLFVSAGKLKIEELMNYAALKLIDNISDENVIEILKFSNQYKHEELREKSFNKIKELYPKCDFKDSHKSNFNLVIKIIQQYEKYEEMVRKLEEEFKNAKVDD